MSLNRIRIQNHLIAYAKAFNFMRISYGPTGAADTEDNTNPVTVLCNEVASTFGKDPNMGRREVAYRDRWTFQLILGFNSEVLLEDFERAVTDPILRLPRDVGSAYDGVAVRLVGTEVQHPVTQQPSGGTKAIFTFDVDPART